MLSEALTVLQALCTLCRLFTETRKWRRERLLQIFRHFVKANQLNELCRKRSAAYVHMHSLSHTITRDPVLTITTWLSNGVYNQKSNTKS